MSISEREQFIWLDQDLCSGCGRCSEIAPTVFMVGALGLSTIHRNGVEVSGPFEEYILNGRTLDVSEVDVATQAAEACPGEIIYIEETGGL
jgi:ferredoxin